MTLVVKQMALVLLAAGQSRRFGKPKLAEMLHSGKLVHHAASTLTALGITTKIAVVGNDDWGLEALGFALVRAGTSSQSASLAAGVSAARGANPSAIMVALGDMPFVTIAHFERLIVAFDGRCIASTYGTSPMPPAIFGPEHFDTLCQLQGDSGAKSLIQNAPKILADKNELADIDTPAQLALAQLRLGIRRLN